MQTPYTKRRGGQRKFGGWEEAGRRRIRVLKKEIDANRLSHKKYIMEVEKEAAERLRKMHGFKDAPAPKKSRKVLAPAPEASDSEESFFVVGGEKKGEEEEQEQEQD